ncbi:hypothetical protein [Halobaculum limi]|uniref:hypothetical protein n=1 Tax=Halobaculum limi TaxID=3031916 RepID=UPI0024063E64|nr:hypothetical protein [Halobaculum sp. YSMS11]
MSAKRIAAVLALIVVVAVGGAAAFVQGIGPFGDIGGGDSNPVTETPRSTGTVYGVDESGGSAESSGGDGGGSSGDSGDSDSGDTQSIPPYTFAIQSIEQCGQTCRDVTVSLDNNRNETATGVTVFTRIYAGNSTDSSAQIWEGKRDVGTVEAGGSVTETSRVDLSYAEAYQVQQNDGWITIVTTVESDNVTITYREQRDVR